MEASFDVPVALIIFNRPEETSRVFSVISQLKPKNLFIISDGLREGKDDGPLVAQTRKVVSNVTWPCKVVTDYSEINLGCNERISSGLTWLFAQVDRAIILEDDCVPDLSFFPFCRELLSLYQDDNQVMSISGNNFVPEVSFSSDYYFTRYPHCWGWATWSRAWVKYDKEMKTWTQMRASNSLRSTLKNWSAIRYWSSIFDKTARGEINSWAYRWVLSCWAQKGLSINPKVNLVSNIGFGENATHTKRSHKDISALPARSLKFPLKHPEITMLNDEADLATERKIYSGGTLQDRALKKLKRFFGEA